MPRRPVRARRAAGEGAGGARCFTPLPAAAACGGDARRGWELGGRLEKRGATPPADLGPPPPLPQA